MPRSRWSSLVLSFLCLPAIAALPSLVPPAAATTFRHVSDRELARQAPVIAEVLVVARDPGAAAGRPATDYTVEVERLLKGAVPGSTLVVRVPGGAATPHSGAALKVWGAPSLRQDDRAILLLAANADGTYRIHGLALGTFQEITWKGQPLAMRDLSEMGEMAEMGELGEIPPAGGVVAAAAEPARDLERFASWLADGSGAPIASARNGSGAPIASVRSWDEYGASLPEEDLAQLRRSLRLRAEAEEAQARTPAELSGVPALGGTQADLSDEEAEDGRRPWYEVRIGVAAGLPELNSLLVAQRAITAQDGSKVEENALAAVLTGFGGASQALGGLDRFDGIDTVVLGNPTGHPDLPASFSCKAGGLASLSGTWYDERGRPQGGNVILPAGAGCLFANQAGVAVLQAFVAYELPRAFRAGALSAFAGPQPGQLSRLGAAAALSVLELESGGGVAKPGPQGAAPPAPRAADQAARPKAAPATAASPGSPGSVIASNPPVGSPPRGYQSRPCGFDMNRNGVIGEPADCHVCDGSTTTPHGDGLVENLVYVSCQTGTDSPTCGSPSNPCRSINFAWNNRTAPAGSAAADIICFRGYCHEDGIMPGVSGKGGSYVKPQSGTEARSWELPANPTMLVGWDFNHNGQYPPYDTADVAVLDGSGLNQAIKLSANKPNSYLELAHFTVQNYGQGSGANDSGFIKLGGAAGVSSHVYIHDLSLQNVNRGRPLSSGSIIFNLFTTPTQLQHFAVANVQIFDSGGYVARGSGPNGGFENGPYRFQNITLTGHSCNDSGGGACADPGSDAHVVGWKLWGYITGIEVLDSYLDLNVAAWAPHASGFGSTAFLPAQCSRNWTIRNNEIRDFKVGLTVQGYATGFCDGPAARPVDGVVFDRNVFRNSYAPWVYGDNGVTISSGGPNPNTSIGSVVISNNFFSSTPGWQGMLYVDAGNNGGADPASIQVVNNTTVAAQKRSGFGAITLVKNTANPPQSFVVKNNIISGLGGGQEIIHTEYAPRSWQADFNVLDPRGAFTWNRNQVSSVAGWRSSSSGDGSSRQCDPSFVDTGRGDFHLNASDTCAKDVGTFLTGLVFTDIEGCARPQGGGWDIGAHEVPILSTPTVHVTGGDGKLKHHHPP